MDKVQISSAIHHAIHHAIADEGPGAVDKYFSIGDVGVVAWVAEGASRRLRADGIVIDIDDLKRKTRGELARRNIRRRNYENQGDLTS